MTLTSYTPHKAYTPDMQLEWTGDTLGIVSGQALELARAVRLHWGDAEHVLARIDKLHEMIVELRDVARQRAEATSR